MTRIEPERIHVLNNRSLIGGQYVLYWMQASQRACGNPALEFAAERAPCSVVEIEGDAVVPVETAYPHQAVSAAVPRRRIQPLLSRFLRPLQEQAPQGRANFDEPSLELDALENILAQLKVDRSEDALRIGLYLNNKYALDGRDPNSYAGVSWCLGLHDRLFPERPLFGKVRP